MRWFYNFKVGIKLIIGFVLVAIIAGVVGTVGVINIQTIDEKDTILYEKMTVPLSYAASMATNFQRIRVSTRDMILQDNLQTINAEYEGIQQRIEENNHLATEFEKTIISDETKQEFKVFLGTRTDFDKNLVKLYELAKENKDEEAFAFLESEMAKASNAQRDAIDRLVQLKVDDANKQSKENTTTANSASITMITFICIAMILAVLLGVYISRIISNPIKHMVIAAEKMAAGDLDININIDSQDEVGTLAQAFKEMNEKMNEVLFNISVAAEQVASGSSQMSDSSIALSQGATEQASSIEQLTASLEEISSQTNQNASNANEANDLSEVVKRDATQGNDQMKQMLKAMDEINDASNSISKIIKVIDEIAFQTNILALNAAVEAARAGQHGKGFAVVAEEVRNLAARSANAAKETTTMIEGSIKKTENGTKIANETADALNRIVQGISKVANIVGDIAIASNEQAVGISQVNQGIIQVSEVVQTNSATSEESAAASEELSSQADQLKEMVSRFKLKKRNGSYNGEKELDPEVLNMIHTMSKKKKIQIENEGGQEAAATNSKVRIALSDKEFGKY